MKLLKNQKGFSLIEGLLVIIAVALIGFIIFYVYNVNKKANDSLNNAGSNSTIEQNPSKSSEQTTSNTPAIQYFSFKELGVKIPLSKSLAGLQYKIQDNYYYVNDDALAAAKTKCDPRNEFAGITSNSFASLFKKNGQYPKSPELGDGVLVKQYETFYIAASYPNGPPCTVDSELSAYAKALSESKQALSNAFKEAKLIQ